MSKNLIDNSNIFNLNNVKRIQLYIFWEEYAEEWRAEINLLDANEIKYLEFTRT